MGFEETQTYLIRPEWSVMGSHIEDYIRVEAALMNSKPYIAMVV